MDDNIQSSGGETNYEKMDIYYPEKKEETPKEIKTKKRFLNKYIIILISLIIIGLIIFLIVFLQQQIMIKKKIEKVIMMMKRYQYVLKVILSLKVKRK